MPHIPMLKDFWGFSKAGRKLAELHLNYEEVEPFKVTETVKNSEMTDLYRVKKMRFGRGQEMIILFFPISLWKPMTMWLMVVHQWNGLWNIIGRERIEVEE